MTPRDDQGTRAFLQRLPLYVGGFLGPFGTVVVLPMFPEVADEFDTSLTGAGLSFSLYLFTFAGFLLFSGTLGERWGRRRTVRSTYLLYAAASVACALAPNLATFLAARALQGVANAFITPLLLAGLAETVAPERFGRQVGIYSSFQALGGGLGPVIGGIAADTDFRYAFWGTMIISLLLTTSRPSESRSTSAAAPQFRSLLTPQLTLLGIAFMFAAAGPIGISALVGVFARQVLDLTGTVTGIVFFAGAMAALVCGPIWGRVLDRFGARSVGTVAAIAVTALAWLPSLTGSGLPLGIIWIVVSACVSLVAVVFQALGASIMPDNRGGALSYLLAFRFVGHGIGPILFIPLVTWSAVPAFLIATALGAVTIAVIAAFREPSR